MILNAPLAWSGGHNLMHYDSHFVVRHISDFSEHLCLACIDVYSRMPPRPTRVVAAACSAIHTSNACSLAQLRIHRQLLRLRASLVLPLLLQTIADGSWVSCNFCFCLVVTFFCLLVTFGVSLSQYAAGWDHIYRPPCLKPQYRGTRAGKEQ